MKERLLGAAVLVLIVVLVVPMLLDGPDEQPGRLTRDLELPAPQSTPARTHVVELDETDDDQPESTPPAGEPSPAAEPAQPTTADVTATASAPAASEPAAAPDPSPAAQGWAVQVGSFTSESNARRLENLLGNSDYPVFVTRSVVQGRVMYRVRVGPTSDRVAAEALAERLRADRQTTQIVEHP